MIFVGASTFIDLNAYRGNALRAERGRLVSLLQTARANALNNVDQSPHGVALSSEWYTLFEGSLGANPDAEVFVPTQYAISLGAGTPAQVVFTQLSGDADYDGDITITDPVRGISFPISINHEGRISW